LWRWVGPNRDRCYDWLPGVWGLFRALGCGCLRAARYLETTALKVFGKINSVDSDHSA